ncbi:hypothetical protein [Nocardia australiensis]|uniref:hypothetical protein n=1 Tax=Nocardia australiensis TaxID=2887191 RepID=UPI001D149C1D|nr:hypothetical protein [Nocardia australiensis]
MKLRSLLHRRQADRLPLLPTTESPDTTSEPVAGQLAGTYSPRTARLVAQEEQLERLLTPSELDLVREHRV